eukprot:gnl/Carplike_NY0171/4523_a6151_377.p1 GENE.gnl/Carplike_NY0171/4523_a6151_377~~gnl/Carplike_NY0171/4523_a6151_377.p1  ORF type:complete len:146 (+),score=16.65 gnl/Carplike_NY0171/4523_a6151_377:60-497(+)
MPGVCSVCAVICIGMTLYFIDMLDSDTFKPIEVYATSMHLCAITMVGYFMIMLSSASGLVSHLTTQLYKPFITIFGTCLLFCVGLFVINWFTFGMSNVFGKGIRFIISITDFNDTYLAMACLSGLFVCGIAAMFFYKRFLQPLTQ